MPIQQQLLVPGRIDIPLILTSRGYDSAYINHHQDKYNYILHKILEQRIFNSSIEADGYSNLHMKTLRGFLGSTYADHILKELIEIGLIQCDNVYLYGQMGSKAKGYRIHPDYVSKSVLRMVFKDETFGKKLRQQAYAYKQKHSKTLTWKNLTKVGINQPKAQQFIDDKLATSRAWLSQFKTELSTIIDKQNTGQILAVYEQVYNSYTVQEDEYKTKHTQSHSPFPSHSVYSLMVPYLVEREIQRANNQGITLLQMCQSLFTNKHDTDEKSIWKIATEKYFMEQPDLTSRIFTNLTNLSGELRQFLMHKGAYGTMINLDIRNSQPYLLSLLLKEKYHNQPLPASVAHYIELTANGTFYEHMMEPTGIIPANITKRSRSAFKKQFFATIFFCKTHYSRRTREGKIFRQHFKEVAELIDFYKEAGHDQLAINMQRREAQLILNTIGGELQERKIWYSTIHDSVVVMEEHQKEVKSLILAAFLKAVGVAPSLNPEKLEPQPSPEPVATAWLETSVQEPEDAYLTEKLRQLEESFTQISLTTHCLTNELDLLEAVEVTDVGF